MGIGRRDLQPSNIKERNITLQLPPRRRPGTRCRLRHRLTVCRTTSKVWVFRCRQPQPPDSRAVSAIGCCAGRNQKAVFVCRRPLCCFCVSAGCGDPAGRRDRQRCSAFSSCHSLAARWAIHDPGKKSPVIFRYRRFLQGGLKSIASKFQNRSHRNSVARWR